MLNPHSEQRLSTDLEYVIPRDPHKPGGELFLILETTFIHRGTGRLNGLPVAGSRATVDCGSDSLWIKKRQW